jgi:lipid-A-disaccharide synthase
MHPPGNPKLVYLIAGEESGDLLGGRLMQTLKVMDPALEFAGIGGRTMQEAGLTTLFPMTDLSVMGLTEVVVHLPRLLARMKQTRLDILRRRPGLVVTIDAPDFCFRVSRAVRASGAPIKLMHYVAPSVWAWRPGRARKIAKFLDHLLALLPFEPPYFEKEGLGCTFVGHPAVEDAIFGDAGRFRTDHDIPEGKRIVLLLPGSRNGELDRLLPLFIECAQRLDRQIDNLFFVVPTLPHLAVRVHESMKDSGLPHAVVETMAEKADAFAAGYAALAASGTVALELGLARIPSVIAYRASAITAFIAYRLVKLDHVSLINLIAGRAVMPEFLQEKATAGAITDAMAEIISSQDARAKQLKGFEEAMALLRPAAGSPSERAAETVLAILNRDAEAGHRPGS